MPTVGPRRTTNKIEKWEVEEAVRTLLDAEEIKKDKKLMGLVNKELNQKEEAINTIQHVMFSNFAKKGKSKPA